MLQNNINSKYISIYFIRVKQVNKFIEFIIENSAIIYKNQSPNDYLI